MLLFTFWLFLHVLSYSQADGKVEALLALQRVLVGLSSSASFAHKDILKLARNQLADKSLPVRSAAAKVSLSHVYVLPFL